MTIEVSTLLFSVLALAYVFVAFVVFQALRFGWMDTRDGAWLPLLCAAFWPVAGLVAFAFGFWAWLVGT